MALISRPSMASALLLLSILTLHSKPTASQNIGVCNGMNADNLPSAQDTVNLYNSNGIYKMRLYSPDNGTLQALQGSGIGLILDVPNENIKSLGSKSSAATRWVRKNVVPYASTVKYIAVGNDVMPGDPYAPFVLPAMQNIQHALKASKLTGQIKVSTAVTSALLNNTYPPSSSDFSNSAAKFIHPILNFIQSNGGTNLLANIYPYFSLMNNRESISVDYALFNSPAPVFTDSGNGLRYQNLFDALVDAYYTALEKAGGGNLNIVVSGTGWPSRGSDAATLQNAGMYYKNLIAHVVNGTPKRPGRALETYLHAMFDEDLVNGVPEKNFGLFTPAKHSKYGITFTQVPNLLGSLCF